MREGGGGLRRKGSIEKGSEAHKVVCTHRSD